MRIRSIRLKGFKRFHDLTIELGDNPKKVIGLVGPNGCGKSSVFDAFERIDSRYKGDRGGVQQSFFSKAAFVDDIPDTFNLDNAVAITTFPPNSPLSKKSFSIRTSYRFAGRLNVTQLSQKPDILDDSDRPHTSIDIDSRLTDNYGRLFSELLHEFEAGEKTGAEVREALIGKINSVLQNILEIQISSVGSIIKPNEGKLFFQKGKSKSFPYDNLSSGEKEVIDIILDLIIKRKSFNDTVFCIDEPELHLNTSVQRKLLIEIVKLIPTNCQLWIATHSIGFLRALQEELKGETQVLDFSKANFDLPVALKPITPSRSKWKEIFSTALEDLTGLIAPKILVYCEGKLQPDKNKEESGLDAKVYNQIFETHEAYFVSSGGQTQPKTYSDFAIMVLSKAMSEVRVLLLMDKDIKSDGSSTTDDDRATWLSRETHRRMLKRKEIENYLFDYEVIQAAYPNITKEQHEQSVGDCHTSSVKENTGALMTLCATGNTMNKEEFKLHLSSYISPSMEVYKELQDCIFRPTTTIAEIPAEN